MDFYARGMLGQKRALFFVANDESDWHEVAKCVGQLCAVTGNAVVKISANIARVEEQLHLGGLF